MNMDMRKRIIGLIILTVFLGVNVSSPLYAQVPGPAGSATAEVPSYLEFSFSKVYLMSVAEGDSDPFLHGTEQVTPDFNFGNLVPQNDSGGDFLYMRGEYWYYVVMIATTSGRRYLITETGSTMSGPGGATLPVNSVLLVPDYQWLDELGGVAQGAPPGSAYVGPATTACATDSVVYQSDNAGLSRMVRAAIAISGPSLGESYPLNYQLGHNGPDGQGAVQEFTSWQLINKDQVGGTYSGYIQFTLYLN